MSLRRVVAAVVLWPSFTALPAIAQDIGPTGPSPYTIQDDWLKPFSDEGYAFGGNSGVAVDSSDRILLLQRGESLLPDPVPPGFTGYVGSFGGNALRGIEIAWQNVVFAVNRNGEVIESWNQWDHLFEGSGGPGPHRIRINPFDPGRAVWVIDETLHQIFVFSNDGSELLMTLGERGVSGSDERRFGRPQDVTFMADGRVLVADGLDNSRVVVLDGSGNYLGEFGSSGNEPGEFNGVHGLAIGPNGLIFVVDRDNRRVQVFRDSGPSPSPGDPPATLVGVWTGFDLPLDVIVNDDAVWVSDLLPPKVVKLDFEGHRLYTWFLPTEGPGRFNEMHSFAVDPEGNVYGSDNQLGRTLKLVPRPDADPRLLIEMPWMP